MKWKKRISTLFITTAIAIMFLMPGCDKWTVTPSQVKELAVNTQKLVTTVDQYQATMNDLTVVLAAGHIIDPNLAAKIAKISTEIDKVQSQVSTTTSAIAQTPLTGDTFSDWLKIILAITTVAAGLFAKKKSDEAKANEEEAVISHDALVEVVEGNEEFKKTAGDVAVMAFKRAQTDTQSDNTREMVAIIKANA